MKPIIALSALLLIACNKTNHKAAIVQNKTNHKIKLIDTSMYTILKYDKASAYYFSKTVKPSIISGDEIIKIENLIDSCVASYNKHGTEFEPKIDDPKLYYKQLIAVINSKGEKEVWVNCFCSSENKKYWKKEIVMVEDGGSCYFYLKINLTKNSISKFGVNGVG